MIGEVVALAPMAFEVTDPADPFLWAAAHFEDMRHRVRGPDIGRIALDSFAAGALCCGIVAGLLQTESVAAEDEPVARHGRIPSRQRERQHVAHPLALTAVKAAILRQLEGQHVAGMFGSDTLPETAGGPECSGGQWVMRRRSTEPAATRGGSTRATLLLSFGLVANLAALMTFTATLNEIAADWSLNASQSGWIGGIYFAGHALAVPFLASASDRMDARRLYMGKRAARGGSELRIRPVCGRLRGGVGLAVSRRYRPGCCTCPAIT